MQRFAIRQEPELKRPFSVSDNGTMLTGMQTPNHELYVQTLDELDTINGRIKESPLEVYPQGADKLFDQIYFKTGLRFKKKYLLTGGKKSVNLQKTYEKKILPQIVKTRQGLLKKKLVEIQKNKPIAERFSQLRKYLAKTTSSLELFKKVVIARGAQQGLDQENTHLRSAASLVEGAESLLYSTDITGAEFLEKWQFLDLVARLHKLTVFDPLLEDVVDQVRSGMAHLVGLLPEDVSANLMDIQSFNFQEAQLRALEDPDNNVMLYRACDITASTLLANQISPENQGLLKTFAAAGGGAFHYATKILEDGSDWVTLEGFAAGDRDREVTAMTTTSLALANVDNSWQYVMYGQQGVGGSATSREDNFFERYTDLRYYLKGMKLGGKFRTDVRQNTRSPVPKNAFTTVFGREDNGALAWQSLVDDGILDAKGDIVDPEALSLDTVRSALIPSQGIYAIGVLGMLRHYAKKPSTLPFIQSGASADARNVGAWYALLGREDDAWDAPANADKAIQENEAPARTSRRLWSELIFDLYQ